MTERRYINWGPEMTPDRVPPQRPESPEKQVEHILHERGWYVQHNPDFWRIEARKKCPACDEVLTVDLEPYLASSATDWIALVNEIIDWDSEHTRSSALCKTTPLESWHLEGLGSE